MNFFENDEEEFTSEEEKCYNTKKHLGKTRKKKEEVVSMAQLLERLEQYEIPPHIAQQLGLSKDWKKSVSTELLQHIITSLEKYENVMKRLSDK